MNSTPPSHNSVKSTRPKEPGETVGRLAPSPTGRLHLGHAFSFLVAWWSARAANGRVVLRIEDVDTRRSSTALIEGLRNDLAWLGLTWDSERLQSSTQDRIVERGLWLAERGRAYPCTCSRRDVARAAATTDPGAIGSGLGREEDGAPQQGSPELRYPGTCRHRYASLEEAEEISGNPAGLRLCVPSRVICFEDRVFGQFRADPEAEVGDFQILRRDKSPCYQLAVVIDDERDGVTEVVRGRDLLPSTARQILLAEELKLPTPHYAHLPLVCDHEGRRLAKRAADLSLAELRDRGVAPERIVGWIANVAGQRPTADPLRAIDGVAHFSWQHVGRADIFLPERPGDLFS